MDTQEVKRQYRLNQWIEIVRQCRSSGQTVSAWCAENNINPKRYYYWLRCVRMAACELLPTSGSNELSIVPVTLPGSLLKANPAAPAIAGSPAPLILRLGSATIELHNDASPELIAHTVKALAHVR
ncbi:IS66 family insertion sequence element accessory protein TnpA [Sporomusa sp.]|uniref:IS66 family insertion sequence element accessory protein TnpA n=1 Tax=Sporomusa sp. TaxID=2078658 RepID=UPI002C8A6EA1|nr:IS66 family insertion sequence element accessory protein TnpB [Sporomusa sp.]HWR08369.1 IS66 family insertion sequence element accessory protein TnpB [Sporomusa sp.]